MNRNNDKPMPTSPAMRCAIYTRKSSEEGLEQEYNSLDAQRDAGEAYIISQKHEGWVCLPTRYDDGGFTGGNMERPALKRLLADIEAGQVDCIVVYKVDRLSRSLIDFSKIMDVLERNKVSFVSVTQQFNTSSSMGRLMLNVLLSFAQFEREMISERTRDKMAAARRKGKWVGGRPVLGYDIVSNGSGGRVTVNEEEAQQVRETLDGIAKQIIGLVQHDLEPDAIAQHVEMAISEAVRLGFLTQRPYDAWRPGMPSGSGWRCALMATPYGVAKASMACRYNPEPSVPIGDDSVVIRDAVPQTICAPQTTHAPQTSSHQRSQTEPVDSPYA